MTQSGHAVTAVPMFAFGVKADINSGTTPALGSYEGGGYERRQDEGR
jgi:hypothetical protein